jgi:hypothetical protein
MIRKTTRTITVGNVQKLPTHREAMNQVHMLRMNINRDAAITTLLTFQALVDHYCQTELLAENKTEKTRKTYRTYLQTWIPMDGYTQAFEPSKRQAQERLADLIMRTETVGHV